MERAAPVRAGAAERSDTIPVVIVGCGPVGLTMSMLLSRQGIHHVLIEKRETVSTLPRARGVTARTVEIWNQLGLGAALDAISLPPLWTEFFVYTETMAGEIFGRMKTDGMQPGSLAAYSPVDYKVAAQDQIDPMLFEAASQYAEARFCFGSELLAYREDGDGIVATVHAAGATRELRANYLIGADGGRSTVRGLAGIVEGPRRTFVSYVNNHLRADLRPFTQGREGTLIWTLKPGFEGLFQMLDGKTFWAVQIQFDPATDIGEWTEERVLDKLHGMIGHPDAGNVRFDIMRTYTYTIASMLPERIRSGRVLLIGDAAHQIPPFGGFGMNTGIQTAHNLAWKLCAVLRGEAPEALFESFNDERLEVARRVTEFGTINGGHLEKLKAAMKAALTAAEREKLVESTRTYGNWNGLDLGVHYDRGAFVPDEIAPPQVANATTDYVSHAKPGYRAPHLWVTRNGQRQSLAMFDRFTLLAGPDGSAWVDSARSLSAPEIDAYRVASDGDLVPAGDFCALYGIDRSGAVLIRPDGHVGLRVPVLADDPAAILRAALQVILCRARASSTSS